MVTIPPEVYIYGSGDFAYRISKKLAIIGIKVISFLEFEGHRIKSNVLLPNQVNFRDEKTVIIGLGNPEADLKSIVNSLHILGFKTILPIQIANYFFSNGIEFNNYWLSGNPDFFKSEELKINKAKELFKEKKSRKLFEDIVIYRKYSDLSFLPNIDSFEEQYCPSDLPWIKNNIPISVVDCGAFNGDTINSFLKKNFIFESYFAFEPDSSNYSLLLEYIDKNNITNIFPTKIATWSENCILNFQKSGGNNSGANITSSTDSYSEKIMAVSLDNFLPNQKINLIKMDIEGAEIPTILGLSKTIKKNNPFLAVSVYHKPTDLWEIPILISELSDSYEMYLRVYGQQTFDTVLYCTPKI